MKLPWHSSKTRDINRICNLTSFSRLWFGFGLYLVWMCTFVWRYVSTHRIKTAYIIIILWWTMCSYDGMIVVTSVRSFTAMKKDFSIKFNPVTDNQQNMCLFGNRFVYLAIQWVINNPRAHFTKGYTWNWTWTWFIGQHYIRSCIPINIMIYSENTDLMTCATWCKNSSCLETFPLLTIVLMQRT